RLEALSEPGGICISEVVRDQVRDKLPYAFEDRGEHQVKNIARPVRGYAMSPAAIAIAEASGAPPDHPRAAGVGRRTLVAGAAATWASMTCWTGPCGGARTRRRSRCG